MASNIIAIAEYRTFDGHKYVLHSKHITKRAAQAESASLYARRVIRNPQPVSPYKWLVYVRWTMPRRR